ncbi:MAG: hypothetical protein NVSMB47_05980 [Polyangiales bacterium]
MIARRIPSLLALVGVLGLASLGAGCVVASEGSSTDPAAQKQWELSHAPNMAPGLATAPAQTIDDRNSEAVLQPLAVQPGHDLPSPATQSGTAPELGFSVDVPGSVGDDPRPHPWEPNPQGGTPTDKPKIGGYDQSSGPIPHK